MTQYLLDTDIASYIIKNQKPQVHSRLQSIARGEWAISAITAAELLEGVEGFQPAHQLKIKVTKFVFESTVLPWPAQAAFSYATIKYAVRQQTLEDLDLLIAAHAIAIDATLVTNNTRHFSRIGAPLRIENWAV